jgi:hypothetical protein
MSDVKWAPLNPARGDASPKAGTLWGDRSGTGPSGFLVKFVDGFSSPPHIHNVTYRGVVISGLIHNDDPAAARMWLPAGSFWTQPKGKAHITAAKGGNNLAYIEIEQGPYLVRPSKQAFDSGERPVNVDKSNIVWLDASNVTRIDRSGMPTAADGPRIAFLWGQPQDGELNGTLIKLPGGFAGQIRSHGSDFRAVVIQGRPKHRGADAKALDPGSFFGFRDKAVHRVSCEAGEACLIYVRMRGRFDVIPARSKK